MGGGGYNITSSFSFGGIPQEHKTCLLFRCCSLSVVGVYVGINFSSGSQYIPYVLH